MLLAAEERIAPVPHLIGRWYVSDTGEEFRVLEDPKPVYVAADERETRRTHTGRVERKDGKVIVGVWDANKVKLRPNVFLAGLARIFGGAS